MVLLTSLAIACGGGSTEATESSDPALTAGGDETAGSATASDVPWEQMTADARMTYMQTVVMPEMQTMFQEFDGERYAEFGCANCHGENMQEVSFAMPNGLAPLNPEEIPAMFGSEDPMLQFMTGRVWPRMAELLQQPPYDPETHQGFSCLHCHATEGG